MSNYANPRVLGLALAAGVAAILVFPELLRYLPFLLIAACPLSMLLMGHGGHGGHAGHAAGSDATAAGQSQYACPMHSDVRSDAPGRCPKCGMQLAPATPDGGGTGQSAEDEIGRLTHEFHRLNEQQASLGEQIERLKERGQPSSSSRALDEAQEVARAADKTRRSSRGRQVRFFAVRDRAGRRRAGPY